MTIPIPPYLKQLLGVDPAPGGPAVEQPAIRDVTTVKTVTKNWGEERWLVPEGSPFGFKLIYIRAGHRTSLQLHEQKEEANLVLRGTGTLFHAPTRDDALSQRPLNVGEIVHVQPGVVHRIAATTDLTIVEVSTPELDDVIRLEDDWSRSHGRIADEHQEGRA